jgi:hypothetical protein
LGASPGLVASPLAATGASAQRLTMNQQAGPKSAVSFGERGLEGEGESPDCKAPVQLFVDALGTNLGDLKTSSLDAGLHRSCESIPLDLFGLWIPTNLAL